MYLSITCSTCSKSMIVPAKARGSSRKCPHCQHPVQVPGLVSSGKDQEFQRHRSYERWVPTAIASVALAVSAAAAIAIFWHLKNLTDATDTAATSTVAPSLEQVLKDARERRLHDEWFAKYKPEELKEIREQRQSSPTDFKFTSSKGESSSAASPRRYRNLPDLIEVVERSVVRITTGFWDEHNYGSGFIIDPSGTLLTNYHVVANAQQADVEFQDQFKTNVIGFRTYSKEKDLIILQIDTKGKKIPALSLSHQEPRKGERVAAFGAPFGLSFSTSEGIVSAMRNAVELENTNLQPLTVRWVQTTAPIPVGYSGGPLVDTWARVVGVNTATGGERHYGLNFAVSVQDVHLLLQEMGDEVYPFSDLPDRGQQIAPYPNPLGQR